MIMWAVLMCVLFILAFAGILYLSNRIGHFSFFRNLAHGKKRLAMFYGFLVTAVFTAAIWFLWGSMNAIVCVLHLLIFWLISDGIFSFIKKHQGGFFQVLRRDHSHCFYCMLPWHWLVSGASCVGEKLPDPDRERSRES